MVLIEELHRD